MTVKLCTHGLCRHRESQDAQNCEVRKAHDAQNCEVRKAHDAHNNGSSEGEAPPAYPTYGGSWGGATDAPTSRDSRPRVQYYPTYGDPAIRGDCSHLKNVDVHGFNKGATKRKG